MKFCITEAYFNLHSIHTHREKYNPTFYALYTQRERERERGWTVGCGLSGVDSCWSSSGQFWFFFFFGKPWADPKLRIHKLLSLPKALSKAAPLQKTTNWLRIDPSFANVYQEISFNYGFLCSVATVFSHFWVIAERGTQRKLTIKKSG